LQVGAVSALQGVRHPVSVARRLLAEEPVLLAAHGARAFAIEHGIDVCDPQELISPEARASFERKLKGHDTVGCVALDRDGHLAAGTSTGGTGANPSGRVGDSPQVGAGFYADDQVGGVSLTGDGEQIARVVLGYQTVRSLADGAGPHEAAERSVRLMAERVGGEVGIIGITRDGRIGWGHNGPNLAFGFRAGGDEEARCFVSAAEAAAAL
ncbi:MAG TPA: isoaspartyl peptidase/L-asparaginase, partial [Deinococcales bacterium]|nr:isoaspartyl peptidase/L-asparaginase [Deinococcales bacterium]